MPRGCAPENASVSGRQEELSTTCTDFVRRLDPTRSVHTTPLLLPERTLLVEVDLERNSEVSYLHLTRSLVARLPWRSNLTHLVKPEERGGDQLVQLVVEAAVDGLDALKITTSVLNQPRRLRFTL